MNMPRRFEPLEDCCCLGAPRILAQRVASMAFNFSAVPERVMERRATSRQAKPEKTNSGVFQIFSGMDFLPST